MRVQYGVLNSIFLISLLLAACGEVSFDTVIPTTSNIYEMGAFLDDKRSSMDEFSIIKRNEAVRPYFVNAQQDAEVTGFQVSLRRADGAALQDKIEYQFAQEGRAATVVRSDLGAAAWKLNAPVLVPAGSGELPAYRLPDTLELGVYTMVFQAKGKDGATLTVTEKSFYYLADAEFTVQDLRMYLAGNSKSRIAEAGSCVMLETAISFDPHLNPYAVWSDGVKEWKGKISDGYGIFLWQTPKITGFKNISVEIFPFPPQTGKKTGGVKRAISVPIAQTGGTPAGYFSDWAADFTHWYLFRGTLNDAQDGEPLQTLEGTAERWLPSGDVYGLGIGADGYLLPDTKGLTLPQTTEFFLRLSLKEDGVIMSARYAYDEAAGGGSAAVYLVLDDGALKILLDTEGRNYGNGILVKEITLYGNESEHTAYNEDFLTVRFSLKAEKGYLYTDAVIGDGAPNLKTAIGVPKPLSGAAHFQLGSGIHSAAGGSFTAVIQELGAIYSH